MKIAYIDFENISIGFKKIGLQVNWARFFVYLKDKYKIDCAKVFIGYLSHNKSIYDMLTSYGYILMFRDAIVGSTGRVKANIDTDLVLESTKDYYERNLTSAVLVSCDGDFDCLVRFRYEKGIFKRLFATKPGDLSLLLKRYTKVDDITYLIDIDKNILDKIKKDTD